MQFYYLLFFYSQNKKKIFLKLLKIDYLIIVFLSIVMFILLNFSATGCLIYPVKNYVLLKDLTGL